MKELLKGIRLLVNNEMVRAVKENGQFYDSHHGYAIILEEICESKREMAKVEKNLNIAWELIMQNINPNNSIDIILESATNLAAEACQVAAMALKFKSLIEKEEQ